MVMPGSAALYSGKEGVAAATASAVVRARASTAAASRRARTTASALVMAAGTDAAATAALSAATASFGCIPRAKIRPAEYRRREAPSTETVQGVPDVLLVKPTALVLRLKLAELRLQSRLKVFDFGASRVCGVRLHASWALQAADAAPALARGVVGWRGEECRWVVGIEAGSRHGVLSGAAASDGDTQSTRAQRTDQQHPQAISCVSVRGGGGLRSM